MFSAILVPNTSDFKTKCNQLSDPIFIYLNQSDYFLCIATEEIALSFKKLLVPAKINTGYDIPVHANQHYYSNPTDIYSPEISRNLIAMKSRLTYSIHENFSSNDLYVALRMPSNETETVRTYIYELMYQEVPCLTTPEILNNLIQADIQSDLGPLIVSIPGLSSIPAPQEYIRETLRDIVEIGDLNMKDKVLITGPKTGELYLFYSFPVNIPEDVIRNLLVEIRGRIQTSIQLKIFPRNVSDRLIQSRRLTSLPSGQWQIQYDLPKNTPFLANRMSLSIQLESINNLFWFLFELMTAPTWKFIEKELDISVYSYGITIEYRTEYLPDYLRVQTASHIHPPSIKVQIMYPDNLEIADQEFKIKLQNEVLRKTRIEFQDQANSQLAILAANLEGLDELKMNKELNVNIRDIILKDEPRDFTLENRIYLDQDFK